MLHIKRSMAAGYHASLILSLSINVSITFQFMFGDAGIKAIGKGIINFFIPVFLPKDEKSMEIVLFMHLVLGTLSYLGIWFSTSYFKPSKELSDHELAHSENIGFCLILVATMHTVLIILLKHFQDKFVPRLDKMCLKKKGYSSPKAGTESATTKGWDFINISCGSKRRMQWINAVLLIISFGLGTSFSTGLIRADTAGLKSGKLSP